jgi:hypothetical protein
MKIRKYPLPVPIRNNISRLIAYLAVWHLCIIKIIIIPLPCFESSARRQNPRSPHPRRLRLPHFASLNVSAPPPLTLAPAPTTARCCHVLHGHVPLRGFGFGFGGGGRQRRHRVQAQRDPPGRRAPLLRPTARGPRAPLGPLLAAGGGRRAERGGCSDGGEWRGRERRLRLRPRDHRSRRRRPRRRSPRRREGQLRSHCAAGLARGYVMHVGRGCRCRRDLVNADREMVAPTLESCLYMRLLVLCVHVQAKECIWLLC